MNKSKRTAVVFASLVGVLTATSALLLALSPAPLGQGTLNLGVEGSDLRAVFKTQAPVEPGRWKFVYIHQTKTPAGTAQTLSGAEGLADHFIIGNGEGAADGEILVTGRWQQQLSALPPTADRKIDPSTVSIALIGDFDKTVPTQKQLRALTQLTDALQRQLTIGATGVFLGTPHGTPAGIGRFFPESAFREQLKP